MCVLETWMMRKYNEQLLEVFEKKRLLENEMWRNTELYHLYNEPDIDRAIKINRLRPVGHLERKEE